MLLEFKRLVRGKNFIFILAATILIILTNQMLQTIFYDDQSLITNEIRFMNIYNSFSQFSFLVFAPLIGTVIVKDKEDNSIQFYRQMNISLKEYFYTKLSVYSFVILGITNIILIIMEVIYPIKPDIFIKILIIINFNLLYCIFVGMIISLVSKKSVYGSMGMIFFWFIMTIINVLPIPYVKGYLTVTDNNSYISTYIMSILNIAPNNFFSTTKIETSLITAILVEVLWIVILYVVSNRILKTNKHMYT